MTCSAPDLSVARIDERDSFARLRSGGSAMCCECTPARSSCARQIVARQCGRRTATVMAAGAASLPHLLVSPIHCRSLQAAASLRAVMPGIAVDCRACLATR